MSPIDVSKIPKSPYLALVTSSSVSLNSRIMISTFRDMEALFHEASGLFVGIDSTKTLKLGGPDAEMVDGTYVILENAKANARYKNIPAMSLTLRLIRSV